MNPTANTPIAKWFVVAVYEALEPIKGSNVLKRKTDKVPVTFMLPREVKEQLDKIVFQTRRTRGGYIELALQDRFPKDSTVS